MNFPRMAHQLAMISFLAASQVSAQTPQPDIVRSAQTAIERMERAEYPAVVTMFSLKLRAKFPEKKVRETWEGVHKKSGPLVTMGTPTTYTKDNLRRVIVPGTFEKSKIDIEIVFNAAGEIAGLLLHRK